MAGANINTTASMRKTCEGCGGVVRKTFRGLCPSCSTEHKAIMKAYRKRQRNGRIGLPPVLSTQSKVDLIPPCECKLCGSVFHPKSRDRMQFCGRDCGLAFAGAKAAARSNGGRVSFKVARRRCVDCSKPFTAAGRQTLCSDECRRDRARRVSHDASKAKHVSIQVKCNECGASFEPEYGDHRRKFCSIECSKRHVRRTARKKERARRRAAHVESVNPISVFERDGWICQQCGVRTPRKLRGTYQDRAPELDHIVPLARGGEHSYRNTQCLCRACNAAKADGPGGQMRLFG